MEYLPKVSVIIYFSTPKTAIVHSANIFKNLILAHYHLHHSFLELRILMSNKISPIIFLEIHLHTHTAILLTMILFFP